MDICFTAGWMKIKKGSFTTGKRKKKSGKILRVVAFHAHAHRNLDRTITDKSFPMKLWQTFDQNVGPKIWHDSHETPLRTKHQLLIISHWTRQRCSSVRTPFFLSWVFARSLRVSGAKGACVVVNNLLYFVAISIFFVCSWMSRIFEPEHSKEVKKTM